jgi:curved DNA-binding protein CbpA
MAVNYTNILIKELTELEETDIGNVTEITPEEEIAILEQFESEDTRVRDNMSKEEEEIKKLRDIITDDKLVKPYELFGLDENSRMVELKKAYYGMALMVHPDKGGTKDEMDILHKAYVYVKTQIENRIDNPKSLEELEAEFKDFCDKQEAIPVPKFSEIYDETCDWIKDFNLKFEEEATKKYGDNIGKDSMHNPYNNEYGYGDMMDKSEINSENVYSESEDYDKKRENPNKPIIKFHKELIAYKGYSAYGGDSSNNALSLENKRVNDFSGNGMNDYMAAYSEPETIKDYRNIHKTKDEIEEDYQKLLAEREEF